MIFRLLFPYLFLLLIVAGYLFYRQMKLGPVLLKVNRSIFTRYNSDSFLLIIILAVASYFLMRFELQNPLPIDEELPLGPYSFVFFYGALMIAVIAREIERPALREKGISSSRGFWKWSEVDSYRWSKDVLTLSIDRGSRKRGEAWLVHPDSKKEIDQLLKKMVPKRAARSKKK